MYLYTLHHDLSAVAEVIYYNKNFKFICCKIFRKVNFEIICIYSILDFHVLSLCGKAASRNCVDIWDLS